MCLSVCTPAHTQQILYDLRTSKAYQVFGRLCSWSKRLLCQLCVMLLFLMTPLTLFLPQASAHTHRSPFLSSFYNPSPSSLCSPRPAFPSSCGTFPPSSFYPPSFSRWLLSQSLEVREHLSLSFMWIREVFLILERTVLFSLFSLSLSSFLYAFFLSIQGGRTASPPLFFTVHFFSPTEKGRTRFFHVFPTSFVQNSASPFCVKQFRTKNILLSVPSLSVSP